MMPSFKRPKMGTYRQDCRNATHEGEPTVEAKTVYNRLTAGGLSDLHGDQTGSAQRQVRKRKGLVSQPHLRPRQNQQQRPSCFPFDVASFLYHLSFQASLLLLIVEALPPVSSPRTTAHALHNQISIYLRATNPGVRASGAPGGVALGDSATALPGEAEERPARGRLACQSRGGMCRERNTAQAVARSRPALHERRRAPAGRRGREGDANRFRSHVGVEVV